MDMVESPERVSPRFLLEHTMHTVDTSGYRTSDFKYHWRPDLTPPLIEQVENYNLHGAEGITQYPLLPTRPSGLPVKVGLTPLVKLDELSDQIGSELYVKCEHHNPSGSFKDRETLIASLHYAEQRFQLAVGFSSGNASCSAAYIASRMNQRYVAVVSGDIYPEKLRYILDQGADVIQIGDEKCYFEAGYRVYCQSKNLIDFRFRNIDDWSVSNPHRVEGNKTIAVEIIKQLGRGSDGQYRCPKYVIVPTANGSCLSGIWKGFKELYDLGFIDRLPSMVSVGVEDASPLFRAYSRASGIKKVRCDLHQVRDAGVLEIGSTIVAEESYDLFNALESIRLSEGLALEGNAADIRAAYARLYHNETERFFADDLIAEPSSMLTLHAVEKMQALGMIKPGDATVIVFTGHGLKSLELLKRLNVFFLQEKKWHDFVERNRNNQYPPAGFRKRGEIIAVKPNPVDLSSHLFELLK